MARASVEAEKEGEEAEDEGEDASWCSSGGGETGIGRLAPSSMVGWRRQGGANVCVSCVVWWIGCRVRHGKGDAESWRGLSEGAHLNRRRDDPLASATLTQ